MGLRFTLVGRKKKKAATEDEEKEEEEDDGGGCGRCCCCCEQDTDGRKTRRTAEARGQGERWSVRQSTNQAAGGPADRPAERSWSQSKEQLAFPHDDKFNYSLRTNKPEPTLSLFHSSMRRTQRHRNRGVRIQTGEMRRDERHG